MVFSDKMESYQLEIKSISYLWKFEWTFFHEVKPNEFISYSPLLLGMTSGFLSSFSNNSSASVLNGKVTFSLTAKKPGLIACEPSLLEAFDFKYCSIITVNSRRAKTQPISIPSTVAMSSLSLVSWEDTVIESGS